MNITAITRYKHGNIFKLLQKLGWSQLELSRRSKLSASVIGYIINLSRRPNEEQANAIQRAFGEAGEYLDVLEEWPDTFRLEKGFKREETADIPVENLLYSKEMMALEFESTAAPRELVEGIEAAMEDLPPRQKKAIEGFLDGRTLAETGKALRVSNERCRQLQLQALHHMRHPSRIAKLNCDRADEEIEEGRKQAAEYAKEIQERQKRDIKEAEERREKERLRMEKFADQLRAARNEHSYIFSKVHRVVYNASFEPWNYVRSVTGEVLLAGQEQVRAFIRKFIDPEWDSSWANFTVTHDEASPA